MATPLTIAIPPLRDGQTIAAWQRLFLSCGFGTGRWGSHKTPPSVTEARQIRGLLVLSQPTECLVVGKCQ